MTALEVHREGSLGVRATYRLRVGDATCDALEQAASGMRPRARLDARGLREDLAVVVQALHEVREFRHLGLPESLLAGAAVRATVALFPWIEETRASRFSVEDEGRGFRWGQMGGLTEGERTLLDWAGRGPYEEFLEAKAACPSPMEEVAAAAAELEWLGNAFALVDDGEVASVCRQVALGLVTVLGEIPRLVETVGRFEEHRGVAASREVSLKRFHDRAVSLVPGGVK